MLKALGTGNPEDNWTVELLESLPGIGIRAVTGLSNQVFAFVWKLGHFSLQSWGQST